MKPRLIVGIVIIIVLAIVAALVITGPKQAAPQHTQQGNEQQPSITVATSTITASTTEYTVDAAYPQFGIPNIDSKIKSTVEQAANSLESQANQDKPFENTFPTYTFNSGFDNVYIGDQFISVRLLLEQYTGGAHGMPVVVGENFHRDTGETVTLDEALALTGKSLDQVAAEAKKQLSKNPNTPPVDMWAEGSDPTTDNYKTFVITKDSVIFMFQPYQVAPYAAGAPEISIPRVK